MGSLFSSPQALKLLICCGYTPQTLCALPVFGADVQHKGTICGTEHLINPVDSDKGSRPEKQSVETGGFCLKESVARVGRTICVPCRSLSRGCRKQNHSFLELSRHEKSSPNTASFFHTVSYSTGKKCEVKEVSLKPA